MIVIVESPLRGDGSPEAYERNKEFARRMCKYFSYRGYAPYASHLFFTQFLDDTYSIERDMGMKQGLRVATNMNPSIIAFCTRKNEQFSSGMKDALVYWRDRNMVVDHPAILLRLVCGDVEGDERMELISA
jgi:hypothetical protein